MDKSKRTVLIWLIASLALLLAAGVVFVDVIVMFSAGHGIRLTTDNAVGLLLLAAALVVASAFVAIGAVAAGTRGVDQSKRAVRVRSIDSLMCLLSILLVFVPAVFALEPGDYCIGDYSTCIGRPLALGLLAFLVTAPLLVLSPLFAIGAIVAGLASAAKSGKRGWFVAILVSLIGSLIIAVTAVVALAQKLTSDPNVQGALVILVPLPLLTPVVTLIYSFSGRERSKGT